MDSKKIVVIEDEPDILEIIEYNLNRDRFRVLTCTDGLRGLEMVRRESPDLVLLDLMLPGMDGIEICRRLKADPLTQSIPVMMVTAKGEESEIVLGLGVGADDYVTKPFSPRELIARVRAVLRRGEGRDPGEEESRISRGKLIIDRDRFEVRLDSEPIALTATEFRLLHFLASHPGRVFQRDQLLSRVIGGHAFVSDRNIDVHIRSIRKKLRNNRELIETIRGVGYCFKDQRDRG